MVVSLAIGIAFEQTNVREGDAGAHRHAFACMDPMQNNELSLDSKSESGDLIAHGNLMSGTKIEC